MDDKKVHELMGSKLKNNAGNAPVGCAIGCVVVVVIAMIGAIMLGVFSWWLWEDEPDEWSEYGMEEREDDWDDWDDGSGEGGFWDMWDEFWADEEYDSYSEYGDPDSNEYGEADYGTDTEMIFDEEEGWVMYWYLCGSDLESEYGSATDDLDELMSVDLPDNVKVVIQTGGAYSWENNYVDSSKMQRFVYDSDGLELVDEGPMENMGEADTLADFLEFASTNYPAEHVIVNLWNHGGGSVGGIAYDENYDYDALDLNELYEAFTEVYDENSTDQPIDIIGFDACLMATIDTAYVFKDLAQYMVASEESEPSTGWNYEGFVQTMADYPNISALSLAINICDTYVTGSEDVFGIPDDITLSVTNLSKIDTLIEAYDAVGAEALENAINDSSFFAQFAQVANGAENYGGNSRRLGYTNMADLGDLIEEASDLLPNTSDALLVALEDCIEYKIYGALCSESSGLACYYSYSGDVEDFELYEEVAAGTSFVYFYDYGLNGDLADDGLEYVWDLDVGVDTTETSLPTLTTLNDMDYDNVQLTVNDDGCAVMDLGPEAYDVLSAVKFELYYADESTGRLYSLGIDNEIDGDWDECIFIDNFRGVWGSIDGELCYMELVYEGDYYNEYSIPMYLNGVRYELEVIYDFNEEEYSIQGARKPLSDSGASDKNLVQLQTGDEIQLLYYASVSGEISDDLDEVLGPVLTVKNNTSFYEVDLDDGYYYWVFMMEDYQGNVSYSEVVTFEMDNGDIYTSID